VEAGLEVADVNDAELDGWVPPWASAGKLALISGMSILGLEKPADGVAFAPPVCW